MKGCLTTIILLALLGAGVELAEKDPGVAFCCIMAIVILFITVAAIQQAKESRRRASKKHNRPTDIDSIQKESLDSCNHIRIIQKENLETWNRCNRRFIRECDRKMEREIDRGIHGPDADESSTCGYFGADCGDGGGC